MRKSVELEHVKREGLVSSAGGRKEYRNESTHIKKEGARGGQEATGERVRAQIQLALGRTPVDTSLTRKSVPTPPSQGSGVVRQASVFCHHVQVVLSWAKEFHGTQCGASLTSAFESGKKKFKEGNKVFWSAAFFCFWVWLIRTLRLRHENGCHHHTYRDDFRDCHGV